ncbi:ribonuclease H-like domain-containing protein [Parasitella parasitica]|nr:ribonuclease H-like domain-containing protein [Parasitella parasitica]
MNDKAAKLSPNIEEYPLQQSITTIDGKALEKQRLKLERQKLINENNARFKTYLDSLPELMYPSFYKVECIGDLDEANDRLSCLAANEKIFGMDLEWPPTFIKGQQEKKTSLVQICSANSILLLQIGQMQAFPNELKRFFEDKKVLKSGVNIGADGLKLYRDFGIKTNGLVELRDIVESVESSKLEKSNLRSLRALAGIFMDQNMPKGKVRISNWSKVKLSAMQIKYAANDAYVSWNMTDVWVGNAD